MILLAATRNLSINYQNDCSYEDVEDEVIAIIRKHVWNILNRGKFHMESLNWLFASKNKLGEFDYADCCDLLDVHPDLIRIRLQYEFYRQELVFMNKFTGVVPAVLRDEVSMLSLQYSGPVLQYVWSNPGTDSFPEEFKEIDTAKIIESLCHEGIIAINEQQMYVTGRIPIDQQNFSWSKYWNFYD